ncbi:MAG TPA: ATP-binding cassette domain-containing protein [Candidatus Evtepia excrementipullorum]|nr:ATP-binding cassette domain-containing protein [Candidatus Evtepia excrementipullorum]
MATILAEGKHLSKTFPVKGQGKGAALHAVSGVDLAVYEGETLALVGESGCGKSTLGRLLLGLLLPTQGQVFFDGQDLAALPPARLRALRRQMQLVFQDTAAALNPRWTVGQSLAEPLRIHNLCPRGEYAARGAALLTQVGLAPDLLDRYPHQLSGGQRQRVGLARALALSPRLVVCDEPVSALDVSVQAQMLNLLADLQASQGLTYVLISHDLGVVRHSADRVCVMFLGRVCEVGPTQALFSAPRHPYTKFLLDSVPRPDPTRRGESGPPLAGEIPSPVHPPSGCRFRTRCPYAQDICAQTVPPLTGAGDHQAACHFPLGRA